MEILLEGRFAAACAVVLLAGTVRGFSGFGTGLMIMPPMALLYDPPTAVVTAALVDLPAVLQLLPDALRHAERRVAVPLGLAAAATLPAGVWLLVTLDPDVIRRIAAVVILVFVAALATGWRWQGRASVATTAGVGASAGLLGGATGLTGPPVILYLVAGPWPALSARGNILGYFTIVGTTQVAVLALAGVIDAERLLRAAALMPLYLLGTWIGTRLFRLAPERFFRRVAFVLLSAIAIVALVA